MDPQFVTIEQRISAGNDWDETVPTTTPDFDSVDGVKIYPPDVAGGLFVFEFTSLFLYEVQQIQADFAGVGTKAIKIVGSGLPDIPIWSSTSSLETTVLITDKFQLSPDERITIVSTAATNAMFARVKARPLHPAPPKFG